MTLALDAIVPDVVAAIAANRRGELWWDLFIETVVPDAVRTADVRGLGFDLVVRTGCDAVVMRPRDQPRVSWDAGSAGRSTRADVARTRGGSERAGERLLAAAAPRRARTAPARLAASARLVDRRASGVADRLQPPHARVRARPRREWHFGAGRSGRWLEETLDADAEADRAE